MQKGGTDKGAGSAWTLTCSLTRTMLLFHALYVILLSEMSFQKELLNLKLFKL